MLAPVSGARAHLHLFCPREEGHHPKHISLLQEAGAPAAHAGVVHVQYHVLLGGRRERRETEVGTGSSRGNDCSGCVATQASRLLRQHCWREPISAPTKTPLPLSTPLPPACLWVEEVGGAVGGELARDHDEQLVHAVALAHQLNLFASEYSWYIYVCVNDKEYVYV